MRKILLALLLLVASSARADSIGHIVAGLFDDLPYNVLLVVKLSDTRNDCPPGELSAYVASSTRWDYPNGTPHAIGCWRYSNGRIRITGNEIRGGYPIDYVYDAAQFQPTMFFTSWNDYENR